MVRLLEEKFDGLELVHIPRRFNEAADKLAKMGSQRQPVPSGIFASDQYKPSIRFEEERASGVGPSDEDAGGMPHKSRPRRTAEDDGDPTSDHAQP